jgi:hypothetical protein
MWVESAGHFDFHLNSWSGGKYSRRWFECGGNGSALRGLEGVVAEMVAFWVAVGSQLGGWTSFLSGQDACQPGQLVAACSGTIHNTRDELLEEMEPRGLGKSSREAGAGGKKVHMGPPESAQKHVAMLTVA